jgi:hypothetical protein
MADLGDIDCLLAQVDERPLYHQFDAVPLEEEDG